LSCGQVTDRLSSSVSRPYYPPAESRLPYPSADPTTPHQCYASLQGHGLKAAAEQRDLTSQSQPATYHPPRAVPLFTPPLRPASESTAGLFPVCPPGATLSPNAFNQSRRATELLS
ncbi:hypothetical protein CMEL01_01091, partial [Colletotrichum melonis]